MKKILKYIYIPLHHKSQQISPLAEFHDIIDELRVLKNFIELNDIRMVQRFHDLEFSFQNMKVFLYTFKWNCFYRKFFVLIRELTLRCHSNLSVLSPANIFAHLIKIGQIIGRCCAVGFPEIPQFCGIPDIFQNIWVFVEIFYVILTIFIVLA